MLLHTILFYFQVQSLMCIVDHTSNQYEKQLTTTIINYLKHVDPKNKIIIEPKEVGGDWISLEVLQSFRLGLSIAIKQLSNLFYSKLPSPKIAIENYENQIQLDLEVSKFRTPFEVAVCSFVPRCLDFLNIFIDETTTLFYLYQLHENICLLKPAVIPKVCTDEKNSTHYLCNTKAVLMIHKLVQNFPEVPTPKNYKKKSIVFLLNAFEHVNSIDKIQMLKKLNTIPKVNIFNGVEQNYFVTRKKFLQYTIDDEKTMKINRTLMQLNNNYNTIFPENFAENLATLSVPDAVNKMFTRALMTLEIDFRFKIYNLYADATDFLGKINTRVVDRNYVKDKLEVIVGDLCECTTLILVYLTDNCSPDHVAKTAVPFGMHLTFCNNWMTYLQEHCPPSGSEIHERNCIVNAILDKLLINFFSITGDVSNYNSIPDAQLTEAALRYVVSIYNSLTGYYDDLPDIQRHWPTFKWLTGSYLLFHFESPEMGVIKDKTIQLAGNNGKPATEVSLADAYNVLLPWHLDVHTILTFHEVLVSHIDYTMDDFVYRHATCISLYLEYVNSSLDKELLEHLSETILWYTKGTNQFREYLSVPGPLKQPKEEIMNVVSAIKNLNQIRMENLAEERSKIIKTIPTEKLDELSNWTTNSLFDIPESEYIMKLNQMLMNNCEEAAVYTSKFLSITYPTEVEIKKETSDIYNIYCKNNIKGVFVDTTVSTLNQSRSFGITEYSENSPLLLIS